MFAPAVRIHRTGGESRMTWWGALGLALSLYGVVVLLEWIYDRIVRAHATGLTPVSLVVRVTNQEAHIEHVLRELGRIFSQRQWENRTFEVVVADDGSHDLTREIVERWRAQHPYFRLVHPGSEDSEILAFCQYPVVIWVDFSRQPGIPKTLGMLTQFLSGVGRT